jgi:hypothetical protein
MTTTVKTTGSGSQVVGRVVIIYDNAKAISPDGMERLLSVESPIFANDRIVTESDGKVSIVINDDVHTQIDLGTMSNVMIDEDIFGGVSPEEITEATAKVEQVQESFLVEGVDLSVVPEAPAAENGHPVADFDRITHEGDISSTAVEKVSVIFDHSDYTDLDNGSPSDPLDNHIDVDDTSS